MIAYVALAIAILAWGLEYPLMKSVSAELGPMATGAVMFSVAAFLLGAQLAVRGTFRRERLPDRQTLGRLLLIGLIGFLLNAAVLLAVRMTSVTNVATLARTDVLFSLLLAAFIFREKVDRSAWWTTPLMLAGIYLLTGIVTRPFGMGNGGDALVLLSAFLVALNAYIIRHTAQRVDPTLIGFVNTATNSALFVVAALLVPPHSAGMLALGVAFAHPVALELGCIAAIFFASYYIALRALPVWRVRLLMLMIPVVAALAGTFWLDENITAIEAMGMALICAGAAGAVLPKRVWHH
ncbi:MAG: DMT family transporter [Lentisphaerae bacterium]|nr:DMT family transporter [Lentisphaerota bacterium]